MNSWYQRQLVYLQHLKSKQITQDNRLPINHLIGFSPSRFGLSWLSLFGLFVAMGIIIEPIVSDDRTAAFADENCVKPSSLQNFLNRVTLGEDHLTRYAATANAIEGKRLEVFRTAKSHPEWNNVVKLAESQQSKVCDLSNPPPFLRSLCNQLRSYSEEEICRHGFTTKEFNQITIEQNQNTRLRSIIQDKQMQLRNN
jgi:hypothetical protein